MFVRDLRCSAHDITADDDDDDGKNKIYYNIALVLIVIVFFSSSFILSPSFSSDALGECGCVTITCCDTVGRDE